MHIRDLGYITPVYLNAIVKKEAYFLNRLPPQVNLYNLKKEPLDWASIDRKFNKTGSDSLEIEVLVYKKEQLGCRLVIERINDDEYKKRLKHAVNSAKSRGVGLSEKHRIRCRYNSFITNVDKKILPVEKIRKTYYLRWQIELVFKTWKSFFEINEVKKVKKERLECQLLAKLLWILLNWRLFQTCNQHIQKKSPEKGVSTIKFFKRCLSFSHSLRLVILRQMTLTKWLKNIFLPLIENTGCEARNKEITHYKILKTFLKIC